MKYEAGQKVECQVLYPASKATNRWQLLASELEQITLTELSAPQALPHDWNSAQLDAVFSAQFSTAGTEDFWQEIYNIIGYLWSLEEEDAA